MRAGGGQVLHSRTVQHGAILQRLTLIEDSYVPEVHQVGTEPEAEADQRQPEHEQVASLWSESEAEPLG